MILIWDTSWQNQQNDLCAQRRLRSAWASAVRMKKAWVLSYPWAHIDGSDQTGQMPRLIWVFAGRTDHFVMPPQLRRSLGDILVWACPSVVCVALPFAYGQEWLEIGSWNSMCGISMKNKGTLIFFFSLRLFIAELCPFFNGFLTFPL